MNKKARQKEMDLYKGLLIILVIIRHVLQYSVGDEGGILTNYIWAVQMPGFMIVAGYFSFRSIGTVKELGRRLLLSVQHYALPFFSWFLIVDLVILGKWNSNPSKALHTLMYNVDGGLWFLWVVFVLSIITSFANISLSIGKIRVLKAGFVGAVCYLILLAIGYFKGLDFLGIKYILYYSIFYLFGWFIRWNEGLIKKIYAKYGNVIDAVCLLVFLYIIFKYDLYHSSDDVFYIALRCIAGFAGNMILFKLCLVYAQVLCKAKLEIIGAYTLEIYASHMYVNHLLEKGDSFFTMAGLCNFIGSFFITTLFTIIIIVVFKSIKVSNFLFYGKKSNS